MNWHGSILAPGIIYYHTYILILFNTEIFSTKSNRKICLKKKKNKYFIAHYIK